MYGLPFNINWKYIFSIEFFTIAILIFFTLGFIFNRQKFEKIFNETISYLSTIPEYNANIPNKKNANPQKKKYKSEERCRELFEGIFKQDFPSVRPNWLKSPTSGKNLELDGYCSEIKTPLGRGLAFEYDGEQHSRYNTHFHVGDPTKFVHQVKNDSWKDQRCKEEGVLLIRIPYYISYHELDKYIVNSLRKYKLV